MCTSQGFMDVQYVIFTPGCSHCLGCSRSLAAIFFKSKLPHLPQRGSEMSVTTQPELLIGGFTTRTASSRQFNIHGFRGLKLATIEPPVAACAVLRSVLFVADW